MKFRPQVEGGPVSLEVRDACEFAVEVSADLAFPQVDLCPPGFGSSRRVTGLLVLDFWAPWVSPGFSVFHTQETLGPVLD